MMQSMERIYAMLLRHIYLLRGSWVRIFDIIYWPTVQMILWGFISQYLGQQNPNGLHQTIGVFLGAVLLWDTLMRVQIGMAFAYMEEIWSRNLGHLSVSPMRSYEWWGSMMLYSVIRMVVGMLPAILLAIPFYGFSLFDIGLPLLGFVFNLTMMGWWLGFLVAALLLRAGPGAEMVAWAGTFMLAPFCAIYYPIDVLPHGLQIVANLMPAAHVFEGLRDLVHDGVFDAGHMLRAFGLNIIYLLLSVWVLQRSFNHARNQGALFQTGE